MLVADPEFNPGGGINPSGGGGANIQFCQIFPKNCMKLKEFGWGGGRQKFHYVDPPMNVIIYSFVFN